MVKPDLELMLGISESGQFYFSTKVDGAKVYCYHNNVAGLMGMFEDLNIKKLKSSGVTLDVEEARKLKRLDDLQRYVGAMTQTLYDKGVRQNSFLYRNTGSVIAV